jgi:hypothetical protein
MDTISNKYKLVVTGILASTLAATPLLAQSGEGEREQETQEKRAPERPQVQVVKHGTIVGAAVTNRGEDDKVEKLGSISDLVLDTKDGHVRYAVLESGGTLGIGERRTPIGWESLAWDAEKSQFTLSMTADAIKKLPAFDPENLRALGQGAADAGVGKGRNGSGGAATEGSRGGVTDGSAEMRGSLMLASKIGDCAVLAGQDKVGSCDTLFIEPKSGCVAFLTVASGGVIGIGETNYVVPWAALRLVKPIGHQEMQIQLGRGKKALETAPKLGDENADVNKPEFRAKVYEFYGVERPAFEPKESKTDH